MHVRSFITHKRGQTNDSIQDSISINVDLGRFALSDGVSDSVLPEIWANVLTNSFVTIEDLSLFPSIEELQLVYQSKKDSYLATLDKEARYIQKLIEKHLHTGAATFIGIELKQNLLKWKVIGDSCLFILNKGECLQCICSNELHIDELGHLEVQFDNFPMQIHSDGTVHGEWISGQCQFFSGYIIMMSDAMSSWFISQYNLGNNPIAQLEELTNNNDFETFVEKEVANQRLSNDDESVILIKVEDIENDEQEATGDLNEDSVNVLQIQEADKTKINDNMVPKIQKMGFIDKLLIKLGIKRL